MVLYIVYIQFSFSFSIDDFYAIFYRTKIHCVKSYNCMLCSMAVFVVTYLPNCRIFRSVEDLLAVENTEPGNFEWFAQPTWNYQYSTKVMHTRRLELKSTPCIVCWIQTLKSRPTLRLFVYFTLFRWINWILVIFDIYTNRYKEKNKATKWIYTLCSRFKWIILSLVYIHLVNANANGNMKWLRSEKSIQSELYFYKMI